MRMNLQKKTDIKFLVVTTVIGMIVLGSIIVIYNFRENPIIKIFINYITLVIFIIVLIGGFAFFSFVLGLFIREFLLRR